MSAADAEAAFAHAWRDALCLTEAATVLPLGFARTGITLAMKGFGLQEGEEVLLSPLTCKVVPLALYAAGLVPRYVDIDPETLNLDADAARAALTPRTSALLFQATYGHLAGRREAATLAQDSSLVFLEDCAQCIPFADPEYTPAALSPVSVFSANLMKPLSSGSGGVLVVKDDAAAVRCTELQQALPRPDFAARAKQRAAILAHRVLLSPGRYWPLFGLGRRLRGAYRAGPRDEQVAESIEAVAMRPAEFQLARGTRALRSIAAHAAHRRALDARFREALGGRDDLELIGRGGAPLYYTPLLTDRKDELLEAARRERTMIVSWPLGPLIYPAETVAELPTYGYDPGSCPKAEAVARRLVGLPTDPLVDRAHQEKILRLVERIHG